MPTEEELAAMSPEELFQFQKQNCVFCQIAMGRVPAKTVYTDEKSVAILDINPAVKGHMLLMPKEHHSVMPQLPQDLIEHLFVVAKGLSQASLRALKCGGITIFVANGVAAGQRAPHFMIHVIPRTDGDGILLSIPSKDFAKKEIETVKKILVKAMSKDTKDSTLKKLPKKKKPAQKAKKEEKDDKKFDLDKVSGILGGKNS